MAVFVVFIVFFLVVVLILLKLFASDNFPWIKFYTRGKESGFALNEINLLKKVAVESSLQAPVSLFWSVRTLDKCLRSMIIKMKSNGTDNIDQQLLAKLFDLRKKIEFDQPKYKIGITTTRKIAVRQVIKITLPGVGNYKSIVVENLKKYFAISYPEGPQLPMGTSWTGQKVNVYFWRPDDAGYVFETKILNDFIDSKVPILHVMHADSLIRSQKRGSVRADVNKNAYLYSVKAGGAAEEAEKTPGIKCMLIDISESGAAILIGGRARAGIAVKVQAKFGNDNIVMTGVVRSVNFNQNTNQSVLHLKSNPLSLSMRNKILGFVYGLFPDV
jgi:c-di-GMP-binding flagellar brake protein YcgR